MQKFINGLLDTAKVLEILSLIGFFIFIGIVFKKFMIPIFLIGGLITFLYIRFTYNTDDMTESDFEELNKKLKT